MRTEHELRMTIDGLRRMADELRCEADALEAVLSSLSEGRGEGRTYVYLDHRSPYGTMASD